MQIRTHEMHQHVGARRRGALALQGGRAPRARATTRRSRGCARSSNGRTRSATRASSPSSSGRRLFADTIYVLTPQGRVIDLPKGATPIDFAYHVHTELGHRCRGAKVDGAMVPLNTPLANGQQVEILAAKQGGPSRDWLNPALGYVRSHGARAQGAAVVQPPELRDGGRARPRGGREGAAAPRHDARLNLEKLAAQLGLRRRSMISSPRSGAARSASGSCRTRSARSIRARQRGQSTKSRSRAGARKAAPAQGRGSVLIVGVDKLLTRAGEVLQAGAARRHRRLRHARPRRHHTPRRLREREAARPERVVAAEWGESAGATYPVEVEVQARGPHGSAARDRGGAGARADHHRVVEHARRRATAQCACATRSRWPTSDQLQRALH